MENQNNQPGTTDDWPTDQQIEETFRAWKLGGKDGLKELLKKRNEEYREQQEKGHEARLQKIREETDA